MTPFILGFDDTLREHDTGPGHPERPARLPAVRAGLEHVDAFGRARAASPEPIDLDVALRLHDEVYLTRVQRACASAAGFIDTPDSTICPLSFDCARRAAGLCLDAARAIARGDAQRGFVGVRPPGHHAERDRSMGFCLLNNVALAADALRREFGLERVLVFDWDVHHGNGTQHLFEADPGVLFVSMHEHPDHQYPGSGYAHERGHGAGEGFTLNLPIMPGTGHDAFVNIFDSEALPRVRAYRPQFVLISAGFDAHRDDPLGHLQLSDDTFVHMTRALRAVAEASAEGRVLSVLEGGYDLGALERCVAAHVRELLA